MEQKSDKMLDKIAALQDEIRNLKAENAAQAEELRIKYLSKKGLVSLLFDEFKQVAPAEKKAVGMALNQLKNEAQVAVQALKEQFENSAGTAAQADLSAPGSSFTLGSRHPISLVRNQIVDIFARLGFTVAEGPAIEDDWHVFSALNFPFEHPARDMQDTFFIHTDPDVLLLTHTSSVQVRVMEKEQPPIRAIFPGRVFRNEAISSRAHCIFHQVEGLYIDKEVSFADLRQTLLYFAKEMFGQETQIRLRPSYFPFTEPSAEMDISCTLCGGKGCNMCKHSGWVEILGCGMVDPSVLDNCKIDSKEFTGFAFGMGIERIALLKYQINDIRLFFENDVRFLEQFKSAL